MTLVIDCFPYNGEEVVELRIKYLYEVVDHFVIVESRYTHSGRLKPFLYFERNRDTFASYMAKITYLIIDVFPSPDPNWLESFGKQYPDETLKRSWWRECYQRSYGHEYVKRTFAGTPFIISMCDADEIPRVDVLADCRILYDKLSESPIYLEMAFFYYNFMWVKKMRWYYAFLLNDKYNAHECNFVRCRIPRENYIPNGGWHFSYFFSKDNIRRKLVSFAHLECNQDQFKTEEFLERCLSHGIDIADRGDAEDLVPNTNTEDLPTGWRELQAYLTHVQK